MTSTAGVIKNGIFNFEGGCYAKVIRLSEEAEPQIYATTQAASAPLLENVVMNDEETREMRSRQPLVDREHARLAIPIEFIDGHSCESGIRRPPEKRVLP